MFNKMFGAMGNALGRGGMNPGQRQGGFMQRIMGAQKPQAPVGPPPTPQAPMTGGMPQAPYQPQIQGASSGLFQQLMQRLGRGNTGFSGGLQGPRSF